MDKFEEYNKDAKSKPEKNVHSNYSDLKPKGKNKNPTNVGWAPGMMFVPPGEGTNRGF